MDRPRFCLSRTAVLTTHFGDMRWVELLLARIRRIFPELPDDRLFVIDQDRTADSAAALRDRLGNVRILRWPRSEPHFVTTGHDHAHVLNLAVREVESEFLIIFDSDAHPVRHALRDELATVLESADAALAASWAGTATRPCFMVLGPTVDRTRLFFDEGQLELHVDTGRLIYEQIGRMGLHAELLRPEGGFGGRWGALYLDRTVYHHGGGSFASADDPRLQGKAQYWGRESEFYKRRVLGGRYELSASERVHARLLALRRVAPGRLVAGARLVLGPSLARRLRRLAR